MTKEAPIKGKHNADMQTIGGTCERIHNDL